MAEPVVRADPDAERAILGGVLLDNGALATVAVLVRARDFADPAHAAVLEAMLALAGRGEGVDYVTLAHELRARGRLEAIGGPERLHALGDAAVTNAHLEAHCAIVAEHAAARRMLAAAAEVLAWGADPTVRGAALLERATRRVAAAAQLAGDRPVTPIDVAVGEAFARIERAVATGARISGLATGFRDLDVLLSGLHPSYLTIVAARPSMGKTAFAMQLARQLAGAGRRVLFFSLEMPRVDLVTRLLAAEAGVDHDRVRSAQLTAADQDRLVRAGEALHRLPIDFDDHGDVTLLEVRAKARRAAAERGLGLVVVDYLQLMKGAGEDNRNLEIEAISRGLKSLAKELGVPVVALAQLNRGPEGRPNHRPNLGDLRDSGAIEQDADEVLFLYRDEVYNKNTEDRGVAEVICAKQRNGPTETVRLRFVRAQMRFEDLDEEGAPPAREALPLAEPTGRYGRGYGPAAAPEEDVHDDYRF